MHNVRCPSCDAYMPADEAKCSVCFRVRTSKEIFRGLRKPTIFSRIKGFLTSKAVFYSVMTAGMLVITVFGTRLHNQAKAERQAEKVRKRAADMKELEQRNLRRDDFKGVPGGPQPIGMDPLGGDGERRPPEREWPEAWKVHGSVFDLGTLEAIRGVRMTFRDSQTGKTYRATTNEMGMYVIQLPTLPDGGYLISLSHRRYGTAYLEDMVPSYSLQSRSRREADRAMLRSGAVIHVPVSLPKGEAVLETNLVMTLPVQ